MEILAQLPIAREVSFDMRLNETEPTEISYPLDTVKVSLAKAKYPTRELAKRRIAQVASIRGFRDPVSAFETVTYWVFEFVK